MGTSEEKTIAIAFADWLSEHCDTIHLGLWKYYEEEGMKSVNKTSKELFEIFNKEEQK